MSDLNEYMMKKLKPITKTSNSKVNRKEPIVIRDCELILVNKKIGKIVNQNSIEREASYAKLARF